VQAGGDGSGGGGVELRLTDGTLLQHPTEHQIAPVDGTLGAVDGVASGWCLRDTGEHGELSQAQVGKGLAVIGKRGGLSAIGAFAERNGVDVELEDLVLGQLALDLCATLFRIPRSVRYALPGAEGVIKLESEEADKKRIGADRYGPLRQFIWRAQTDLALDQIFTEDPYPIKGMWIQTCNPLVGIGLDPRRWLEALKKLSVEPSHLPTGYSLRYAAFWIAFAVASWGWMVVLLGAGHRLARPSPRRLTRASRSVLPFYIFHQTVIVIVAYPVVSTSLGVPMKFGAIALASMAITVTLVSLLGRWAPARVALGLNRP